MALFRNGSFLVSHSHSPHTHSSSLRKGEISRMFKRHSLLPDFRFTSMGMRRTHFPEVAQQPTPSLNPCPATTNAPASTAINLKIVCSESVSLETLFRTPRKTLSNQKGTQGKTDDQVAF